MCTGVCRSDGSDASSAASSESFQTPKNKAIDCTVRILVVVVMALLLLTIVFLGLISADLIHGLAPLYSFTPIVGIAILWVFLNYCRDTPAKSEVGDMTSVAASELDAQDDEELQPELDALEAEGDEEAGDDGSGVSGEPGEPSTGSTSSAV